MIGVSVDLPGWAGEARCCRDVSGRLGYLPGGRYGRLVGEFSGDLAGHGDTDRVGVRLPPRRLSFVGRTADLGEVGARLARYPVVTLTGVGGVGKTALAVEAAWIEVSAGRAERACYVDLVPCRGDEQVVAALLRRWGSGGPRRRRGLTRWPRRCRAGGGCWLSTTAS